MGQNPASSPRSMMRIKIVLLGDGGVGKTSLAKRYLGKGFSREYITTIGVDFYTKTTKINYKGREIEFQWLIWDLAGQPHWKEVRKSFYVGAHGAFVVFDVTNRTTMADTHHWIREFINNVGKRPMILIGNKIDLRAGRSDCVSTEEGVSLAETLSKTFGIPIEYIETSAKTGENVDEAFNKLAVKIFDMVSNRIIKK